MTRFRFAALAVLAVFPSVAAAGPVLDARIDGAVTGEAAPQLGTGVGARLGLPIDLGPIELVPEAGASFWLGDGLIVPDVGARARFGAAIQPGLYAHALFPLPTPGGPTRGWDAGASLDVTLLPVDIGVHAGALTLGGPALPTTTSLVAGVRLGIAF